jgi:hypothetical protein
MLWLILCEERPNEAETDQSVWAVVHSPNDLESAISAAARTPMDVVIFLVASGGQEWKQRDLTRDSPGMMPQSPGRTFVPAVPRHSLICLYSMINPDWTSCTLNLRFGSVGDSEYAASALPDKTSNAVRKSNHQRDTFDLFLIRYVLKWHELPCQGAERTTDEGAKIHPCNRIDEVLRVIADNGWILRVLSMSSHK